MLVIGDRGQVAPRQQRNDRILAGLSGVEVEARAGQHQPQLPGPADLPRPRRNGADDLFPRFEIWLKVGQNGMWQVDRRRRHVRMLPEFPQPGKRFDKRPDHCLGNRALDFATKR
jgi:hypothetical protein